MYFMLLTLLFHKINGEIMLLGISEFFLTTDLNCYWWKRANAANVHKVGILLDMRALESQFNILHAVGI